MFYFPGLFLVIALGLFVFYLASKVSRPTRLKVLSYSSFAGVYGPGRLIQKHFESFCQCRVEWFLAEDSTALWQRYSLLKKVDVVIGWDQMSLPSAGKGQWESLSHLRKELVQSQNERGFLKKAFFENPYFLPLDWAPVGFLHKNRSLNITSLKSLTGIKGRISFPEPRSSVLGLQFYYWIYTVFEGDINQINLFLQKLKEKIYGPVFSWSLSYGFFQKGRVDMSLSYLSSLLYHQKEEPDKPYFFSYFEEGQPYQVEYVSVSRSAENKKQALQFVRFLLSKEIQQIIMDRHYMFPLAGQTAPHELLQAKPLRLISYKKRNEFIKKKEQLLRLWEEALY